MYLENQSKKVVLFSEKINEELLGITNDLMYFALEQYENEIMPELELFFDQFPLTEEEKGYYYPYYFWWQVFCSRSTINNNKTIYQMFLHKNRFKFKKKNQLERTLLQWQYVIPSYFYIEKMASQRVFGLFDIFDYRDYKAVIVPQETITPPASNDVLAGMVLPLADGGYFSVIDFFIIPEKIRAPLISKLISFYQNNNTISTREFFSRHYPLMLKMTIDHLIENKMKAH
jgi:hypothetical protein